MSAGLPAPGQAGGDLPHRIGMHSRTHQCTRQLPPLRRQEWIKWTHSLKCFLLEKKVTGKAVLGGGQVSQELSPPHLQTARGPQPWVLPAASVYSEWGLCLESGAGSIAGSHRGWPHLSSGYKEQGLGCGEGEGAIFLGSATRGAGTVVSSGLEEPQRARLQPESILSSRYRC